MKIRESQFRVFQERAESSFVTSLAQHLRLRHGEALVQLPSGSAPLNRLPEELIRALVRQAVSNAGGYEITWQSSVAAFVVLSFTMAPNFHEHRCVAQVLQDASVAPDNRIDQLWDRTTERTWQEVLQAYDVAAWRADLPRSNASSDAGGPVKK